MSGPLSGYKIIELAGIGPGPYAGQLFADLGAEVVVVKKPRSAKDLASGMPQISDRGKKSIVVDLTHTDGVDVILQLVKSADGLFEGNRPGVAERLGVGPEHCHAVNPKLVYGRMTGWGQTGPWAQMAGHDINYIGLTGALLAMGENGKPPTPPLNLVGDYGGGSMVLVIGMLSALLQAARTGEGDVIDAAILDGTSSLMSIIYTLDGLNRWTPERDVNLLDGSHPYYRCYKTKDEKFVAVGCIEPQFFSLMLETLDIDPETYGGQNDRDAFPLQHKLLEGIFETKTRDEWAEVFDGIDACVTPLLDYQEAKSHPQNQARGGLKRMGPFTHPRTAPAFGSRTKEPDFVIPLRGADYHDVLSDAGLSETDIEALISTGVVEAP